MKELVGLESGRAGIWLAILSTYKCVSQNHTCVFHNYGSWAALVSALK